MSEIFQVQYFTDPLCSWSWGMEPQMRKLKFLLRKRLSMTYVMGGLLRDWKHFQDPFNDVDRPAQMGPLWMEVRHTTGQPLNEAIWIENPVDTSYLACMAVKAAGVQSFIAEEAMLRELREGVMMKKKDISDKEVILHIAEKLSTTNILDFQRFRQSFFSDEAAELFQKDLDLVKTKGIGRFPTLLITYRERTLQITGYRPFPVLLDAFKVLDPDLHPDETIDVEKYASSWAFLTAREKKEVSGPKTKEQV